MCRPISILSHYAHLFRAYILVQYKTIKLMKKVRQAREIEI